MLSRLTNACKGNMISNREPGLRLNLQLQMSIFYKKKQYIRIYMKCSKNYINIKELQKDLNCSWIYAPTKDYLPIALQSFVQWTLSSWTFVWICFSKSAYQIYCDIFFCRILLMYFGTLNNHLIAKRYQTNVAFFQIIYLSFLFKG